MDKHILVIIVSLVTTLTQISAQNYEYINLGDISKSSNGGGIEYPQNAAMVDWAGDVDALPRNVRVIKTARSEVKFKDVTLEKAGTLASILGDEIEDIDSIVVRGPINDVDLYTMWSSSFYGGLTVINLEFSELQGNRIPNNAFWYQSEQYTPGSEYINCIPLRRIILPEGLKEIGECAFSYAVKLEDINFPSSLMAIKRRCFSDCISLNVNPLVIPKGVEEIETMSFVNCKALTAKIILPPTLKRIKAGAFFSAKITECNFPEGLEEIGDAAFYATRLKEAILPNSCQYFTGDSHFSLNYELEKVHLPEGLTKIPENFVDDCINLIEFLMPNTIEEIGYGAFWQCGSLKQLHLSTNLKSIGKEGLYYCKGLNSIVFPSTLETLGAESCEHWKRIETIYCAAQIPPVCMESETNPGWTPFGEYSGYFDNRTPQDTPIYVPIGSADLYRNAWGWNYFTNFIETNDFPSAGVDDILIGRAEPNTIFYDLFGRKVKNPVPGNIYIQKGKKFIY